MRRLKHNHPVKLILVVGLVFLQLFSKGYTTDNLSAISIIPKPVSVIPANGSFTLTNKTVIFVQAQNNEAKSVGEYFASKLRPSTGFELAVKTTTSKPSSGNIYLRIKSGDTKLGSEGYELTIKSNLIILSAQEPAGLFNGVQTIRQLFPARVESSEVQAGLWKIPAGVIRDTPEFGYRGAMLDVARHFFQVEDVKRYIDLIATYKMNILHLHLSDDQGWRIEIKKWPNLTSIGGSKQVGGGNGGFFTQDQYSDIVKYAADRYMTIIPEIDMPGHINAAMASYPELNCNNKATELYTGTEVGFSSFCTSKEITYDFISDVLGEISAITPGPYIHIGGDESHVTKLEDYIPFVNRVQQIVSKLGKKVIGWDEIALSTLIPNSAVQFWAKSENAVKGVAQSAKVIMSPAANAYLDMKYDSTTTLGLFWAGYVEADKAYKWDPSTLVPGIGKENILGIEAPVWTETLTNMHDLEYMVFPRILGIADLAWRSPSSGNWDEYKTRLAKQGDRLKFMKVNYYPSKLIPW